MSLASIPLPARRGGWTTHDESETYSSPESHAKPTDGPLWVPRPLQVPPVSVVSLRPTHRHSSHSSQSSRTPHGSHSPLPFFSFPASRVGVSLCASRRGVPGRRPESLGTCTSMPHTGSITRARSPTE